MGHKKSVQAERDLQAIYEYTFRAFGEHQADTYLYELEGVFELLADQPRIGRPFLGSTRQFVHGRHIILYRIEGSAITIGRIFHGAQRPEPVEGWSRAMRLLLIPGFRNNPSRFS